MIILGIDPGFASLGYATIAWAPGSIGIFRLGTIVTSAEHTTQHRVVLLWHGLQAIAGDFDAMAIEAQARTHAVKQGDRQTNGNAALARVGEGVARAFAASRRIPVVELEPSELRSGLGLPANASKEHIARMAYLRARVEPGKQTNHATDALGLAIVGGARFSVTQRIEQFRKK